jgi:hypothetical protein
MKVVYHITKLSGYSNLVATFNSNINRDCLPIVGDTVFFGTNMGPFTVSERIFIVEIAESYWLLKCIEPTEKKEKS